MPTLDEVVEVIAEGTGIDAKLLVGGASLRDLGLTSYAMMRLIMLIEEQFDCELPESDLADVFTMPVAQIRDAIERSSAA